MVERLKNHSELGRIVSEFVDPSIREQVSWFNASHIKIVPWRALGAGMQAETSLRASLKSQKAPAIRLISEAEFGSWPNKPKQRRWSLSFHSRERGGDGALANQKSFRQPIDGEALRSR